MRQNILYNISETEFLIWWCRSYSAELDSHQQIKYNYLKTIFKYSDSPLRIKQMTRLALIIDSISKILSPPLSISEMSA